MTVGSAVSAAAPVALPEDEILLREREVAQRPRPSQHGSSGQIGDPELAIVPTGSQQQQPSQSIQLSLAVLGAHMLSHASLFDEPPVPALLPAVPALLPPVPALLPPLALLLPPVPPAVAVPPVFPS